MLDRPTSRRRLLAGIAGGAAALSLGAVLPRSAGTASAARNFPGLSPTTHLAWVWQFDQDGEAERIRDVLAAHQMGIALKTHDGVQWMAKYDKNRRAVSGPRQVEELASFFEAGGVPFHAWCVVQGVNPQVESSMAASVLAAGARSLSIDLESYPGFWAGTTQSALQYTGWLRHAQPDAQIMVSMDARPWEIDRIPLREFAAMANALAPQAYWSDFGTSSNISRYRQAGVDPGLAGVTPLFTIDTAARKLNSFGLPIHPIGPGLIADAGAWGQFLNGSYAHDAESFSVWRFGTTKPGVFELLKANPPRPRSYVVKSGDTLGLLAARWNSSVEEVSRINGLTNANLLMVGQVLVMPRVANMPATLPSPVVANTAPAPTASTTAISSSGGSYVIQPGDSVGRLAERWDTTSARIIEVNGLRNANVIVVGQTLRIP